MHSSNPLLRVNPGGGLSPPEVVGRDAFVDRMRAALERQSILLTAERRMGKTSVLVKMIDEAEPNMRLVKTSLQGVTTPGEFVSHLISDTERAFPGLLKRPLGKRIREAGVSKIELSPLAFDFEPSGERSWKAMADDTVAAIDQHAPTPVVFLWDELPDMIAKIRDTCSPRDARQVLDLLRSWRETHRRVRMVFSGSLGLHHVVDDLRSHGGMWVPTHDMLSLDLPPLVPADGIYLAHELLRNEEVACEDGKAVAEAIATEVDHVPYYIHHTVHRLMLAQPKRRYAAVDPQLVQQTVDEAIRDPQDPWELSHYVERVRVYYGARANLVKALLDVVSQSDEPPTLETIHSRIGAYTQPPPVEELRDLLTLLSKDHYLDSGPAYSFNLELVRRAWLAKRP